MPDWKTIIRERLGDTAEESLTEELTQHLEDTHRDLLEGGATADEALATTLNELKDADALRAMRRPPRRDAIPAGEPARANLLADVWRDLRYAVRSLRRTPIFVVFAVLTLALGIGANTTVFTIVNTLILNPLPVPNSGELATVAAIDTGKHGGLFPVSYRELEDYRAGNRSFRALAGFTSPHLVTLQENGSSERFFTELATPDYFTALDLKPAKGRFFRPDDEAVTVLNYGTWQTRFAAREDIVGSTLRINGMVVTIIGVTPPHFIGVHAIFGPESWMPASICERLMPNEFKNALTDRNKTIFQSVGRLNPGVSRAQADADMTAVASALAREFPKSNEGHTATVRPIRDIMIGSANGGPSPIVFASVVLSAVVGIVLLIACSNVANLLLARSSARRQEMAVRLAIGASRTRLVRQLLTESVLLGFLGGALGLLLGYTTLQFLFSRLPAAATFATPKLDTTVFLFGLALSLFTGLVFGIMPALRTSRADVATTLKEEARTAGRSRGHISIANALVVGQVALSFLLLVTAALCLRSIGRAYQMDPGFEVQHLATFMTSPGQAGYAPAQARDYYRAAQERVASLPGVASATWASNLPLWTPPVAGVEIEGRQQRSSTDTLRAIVTIVDRDYFATAGVVIVTGRQFTTADREQTTPVAIVNEKLARDFWPGGAIGRRLRLPGETQLRQVIGVAKNANYSTLGEDPQLAIYVPFDQHYAESMTLYVRSRRAPEETLAPVERELRAVGPEVVVSYKRTGTELVDGGLFQARIAVGLLAVFGLLALALASIGLYGILAYSVNRRKREIGLRMALGATRSSVLGLVLKQGMSLVAGGLLLGFALSIPAARLLSGMLYGLSPSDPVSVAAAAFTLSAVALLACYLPALLATRVDPLTALREV